MEEEANRPMATVPIHVPQPEEHGPPTLAQPASGPVAEMSGALKASEGPTEPSKVSSVGPAEPPTVNGFSKPSPQPPTAEPEKPTEPSTSIDASKTTERDTEMKEEPKSAPAPEPSAELASAEATKTPVSAKKAGNGKRKSTGGVPEHKNKKLNKKKSQQKITHLDAQPGEFYFARLKSYPPWPSIICDEEMLPNSLLSTRPVTTKREDGTYRELYADGGKKEAERTFPVMFLHTNEFAWIPNTDLTPLNPEECKDVTEKGKSKALIAAYQVAAENHDLQHFKEILAEHENALQAEAEKREQREAEKAAKAERKKRKSDAAAVVAAAADEDVDMEGADEVTERKKSSKKRKKEPESDDEEPEKPAKTPKTKLKLTTSKTPTTTEKKAKDTPKPSRARSERKSRRAADSDEEMADAELKEPEKVVDPVEERKAREKEVLFLRHKLQKGFLSRDQAPQEDEMPQMSNYIKKLENYEDLEVSIIRTTKINKVLKAIIKLNTIPKDETFNFRSRSMELLNKMSKVLGASDAETEQTTEPVADKEADTEPATNGLTKEESEKPRSVEPAPEPVVEPASDPAAETATELHKPVEPAATSEPAAEPAIPAGSGPVGNKPEPAPLPTPAAVSAAPTNPVNDEHKAQSVVPEPATVESEKPTPASDSAPAPAPIERSVVMGESNTSGY